MVPQADSEFACSSAARNVHTPPAVKRLKRFAKLTLQPGESRDVHFRLTRDDFSFVGADGKRVLEPGAFSVVVGGLTRELILK